MCKSATEVRNGAVLLVLSDRNIKERLPIPAPMAVGAYKKRW